MTKPLLCCALATAFFLFSCKKQTTTSPENSEAEKLGLLHFTKENIDKQAHYLLQDDEPESVSFDAKQRSFLTTKPLQISVANDSLYIRFYSPRPLKDLDLYIKTPNNNQLAKLVTIDEVPAFADLKLPINVLKKENIYETEKEQS